MKMKNTLLVALLAGATMLAACDDKKKEGGSDKAAAADDGLPKVCADYLKELEGCVKKVPAMETSLKAQRDAFKAANTPEAKKALETSCKAGFDALKKNAACK